MFFIHTFQLSEETPGLQLCSLDIAPPFSISLLPRDLFFEGFDIARPGILNGIRINILFKIFRMLQRRRIDDVSGKMFVDSLISFFRIVLNNDLHNTLVFLNNTVPGARGKPQDSESVDVVGYFLEMLPDPLPSAAAINQAMAGII